VNCADVRSTRRSISDRLSLRTTFEASAQRTGSLLLPGQAWQRYGSAMIYYLNIVRDDGDTELIADNDANDSPHDRIRSVEMTLEQHYGIRVRDDDSGRTWIELREGAEWSVPVAVPEFVRAHLRPGTNKT